MNHVIRSGFMGNIDFFKQLHYGELLNAKEISEYSGQNQVKGIHTLRDNSNNVCGIVILCNINGNKYKNEWIEKNNVLKYYAYGLLVNGVKTYKIEYSDNDAIVKSGNNYPIYAFVRDGVNRKYKYEGEFFLLTVSTEADGAIYFILSRKSTNTLELSKYPIYDNENFYEGQAKERLHKYKERNPVVIKKAKERFKELNGKLYCEICEFCFEDVYGALGRDYIEGHHTIPVADLNENDVTNISDILLVCSNCHRMIHRRKPLPSKGELRKLINSF